MNFLELSKERYSCRRFKEEQPTNEEINKILEAANNAPTAVNKQPFHIWVIKSEEALDKTKKCTKFHFRAPLIFVLGTKEEDAWVRKFDDKNFADIDGSIVGTHMMLEIQNLGLGTTWVGHFDEGLLKESFPEMKDYNLIAMFPTGYPSEETQPSPMHEKRKDLSELVDTL